MFCPNLRFKLLIFHCGDNTSTWCSLIADFEEVEILSFTHVIPCLIWPHFDMLTHFSDIRWLHFLLEIKTTLYSLHILWKLSLKMFEPYWKISFLLVSWTVQLSLTAWWSRPLCLSRPHHLWTVVPGARWVAGAWPGSTATNCHLCFDMWMWTSSPIAGATTTSGSQITWCVLALLSAGKTPVRWGTEL